MMAISALVVSVGVDALDYLGPIEAIRIIWAIVFDAI
jgi:hypothetical protein